MPGQVAFSSMSTISTDVPIPSSTTLATWAFTAEPVHGFTASVMPGATRLPARRRPQQWSAVASVTAGIVIVVVAARRGGDDQSHRCRDRQQTPWPSS